MKRTFFAGPSGGGSPEESDFSRAASGTRRPEREDAGCRSPPQLLKRAWVALGELLLPRTCAVCGAEPAGCDLLCADCAGTLRALPEARCPHCARACPADSGKGPAPGAARVTRCAECRKRPPPFRCVVAAMRSAGVVREVIHGFKYEGKRHLLPLLGRWIAEAADDPLLRAPPVEAWVPVPLHWSRLWWRGFNQAALLARAVARKHGGPCIEALHRTRSTGTQTRLEKEQRWQNLHGSIGVKKRALPRIRGREVVVVDDVLTTGATAHACAHALLRAGARGVRILTVARG